MIKDKDLQQNDQIKIIHVHQKIKPSSIYVNPFTKKICSGVIESRPVSYRSNYLSHHKDFKNIRLVARWSKDSIKPVNHLMTKLIGHEIRGSGILALQINGNYINFDIDSLNEVCNIVITKRNSLNLL